MLLNPNHESALIASWKNGDERAFDQLFKLHFYKLHQFALRHTNNAELAEELVMDMMLKVWQKKEELEISSESLAPFLFYTLKAAIVDNYRKKKIECVVLDETIKDPEYLARADDRLLGMELNALYQESLRHLSPQRRRVLEMRQEQGMTYKEIATELNISAKTVDRHLADSVAIVRTYLRKHTDIALLMIWLLLF